jgi:hypothetical protein
MNLAEPSMAQTLLTLSSATMALRSGEVLDDGIALYFNGGIQLRGGGRVRLLRE